MLQVSSTHRQGEGVLVVLVPGEDVLGRRVLLAEGGHLEAVDGAVVAAHRVHLGGFPPVVHQVGIGVLVVFLIVRIVLGGVEPSTVGHPHAREDVGGADPLSGLRDDLRLVLVIGEHIDGDVGDAQQVLRYLLHLVAAALLLAEDDGGDLHTVVHALAIDLFGGGGQRGDLAVIVDGGHLVGVT